MAGKNKKDKKPWFYGNQSAQRSFSITFANGKTVEADSGYKIWLEYEKQRLPNGVVPKDAKKKSETEVGVG